MQEKDFDYLFPQEKISPRDLRGYVWKVIVDPTCNDAEDDPGMFYGRLFRMIDIRLSRDEKSTWPNGIIFENVESGNRLTFQDGELVDLTNATVIRKKPRTRNRRSTCKRTAKDNPVTEKPDRMPANKQIRRFVLIRDEDLTGVSGTGEVAEGTVFRSGITVIHWLREPFALGVYQTLDDVISIHGHEGRTRLQFLD